MSVPKNILITVRSLLNASLLHSALPLILLRLAVATLQGANRGIGLALVGAVLSKQPTSTVIATVRVTSSTSDLLALQKTYAGRLEIVTMDIGDEASVKERSPPPLETHLRLAGR